MEQKIYIIGTYDTKGAELLFIRDLLIQAGKQVVTVDVSALYGNRLSSVSPADVAPEAIAQYSPTQQHPQVVFDTDRGTAIANIIPCLSAYLATRGDIAGTIGIGGSGGTALVAPGMRDLPIGTPKLIVSTVASGDTKPYVGSSDLTFMHSVADIAGLNSITRKILTNASHAMAGMAANKQSPQPISKDKPALGITMFGVTTPCVNGIREQLGHQYEPLIFHATGAGGQAMERLASERQLAGIIDVTTTEVADHLFGGVFSAGEQRLDAVIESRLPYVGSVGALDMVNFGAADTIPIRYRKRLLHKHNPQVTLMRTTPEESQIIGEWLAQKFNQCKGPVRVLLPEKGISLLDAPNMPFYDPEADEALFSSLEQHFISTPLRQLLRLPYAINDTDFSAALVESFFAISAD